MKNLCLLIIAMFFIAYICNWMPLSGGDAHDSDNTNAPSEVTPMDLLRSESSVELNQTDSNNNAVDALVNELTDSVGTLQQQASEDLDEMFKKVDESKGVAPTETMPDPMEYPQQASNQVSESQVEEPESEPEQSVPEVKKPEEVKQSDGVLGYDSSDNMFSLEENTNSNDKLKPNELLPKDAVDMTDKNFLTSTITDTENRLGKATQINRNRKNYDLRSTPVIKRTQISPWNISTIEPDTERRQFEIGASDCPPCPSSENNNVMPVGA